MAANEIPLHQQPQEWHVTANTGKLGPLTLAEVAALASSGRIAPRSLAWKSGMTVWQPCGMIPELAPLFPDVPPPAKVWGARLRTLLNKLRGIEAEVRPHIERLDTSKFRLTRKQWSVAGFVFITVASFWVWRSFIHVPAHDEFMGVFMELRPADPRYERERAQREKSDPLSAWQDFVRIENDGGEYLLSEKMSGKWVGPQKMTPMDRKALSNLFGEEWMESKPIGLINPTGQTAVLRIPEGWEPEDFVCTTGYIILKPSGPIQIMKKEAEKQTPTLPTLRAKVTPTPTPEPTVAPEATKTSEERTVGRASKSKPAQSKIAPSDQASAEPPVQTLRLPSARPKGSKKSPPPAERKIAQTIPKPEPELEPTSEAYPAPESPAQSHVSEEVADTLAPRTEVSSSLPPMIEAPPAPAPAPALATVTPTPLPAASSLPTTEPKSPAARAETESPKPSKPDVSPNASLEIAQKRAADARARLSSLTASGRTTLKEEFLKNGDAFMKTSKERAASKDSSGAVFYAERAEATFRQGEQAISGGK